MKHLLVVDDNKTNLAAAKAALADTYKVTAVLSGEQALMFLSKNRVDLILLDINMPGMDGFEVLAKIREIDEGEPIPVIFLTADNDAETENRCLELGAFDFIAKPFIPNVMRARITRILELEDLRKSLATRLDQKIQEVDEMKNKSSRDALTGLWNRSYTEEMVNKILKEGGKGTLFMMDMDNFKAINDTYGHLAGDNTLKMFAQTMMDHSDPSDVLCRIGGDEFVMFINGVTSKNVLANLAKDMITDMVHKIEECKYETNTSVSIGIAQYPGDGEDFNKLYNSGDKALYLVKQNGKNSYHFFSEAKEEDDKRASTLIDLKYLKEMMSRSDANNGAYVIDYDNFQHVYNFIRRFVERSNREVQTLLFTLNAAEGRKEEVEEVEAALSALEDAIFCSLRRMDVSTRYSSKQVIVILMDASAENTEKIAARILGNFERIYKGNGVTVEYSIAKMEGKLNRVYQG